MQFNPSEPDGRNNTLKSGINSTGLPEPNKKYQVPARCGVAVRLKKGQAITIENTHGTQVCDFWAFQDQNNNEFLSMADTRMCLESIFPKTGDNIVSNTRRPMFKIIEDTSPGYHDTLMACCDLNRYKLLGCKGYHDNCTDNLRMALMAIGLKAPLIPNPLNLWMNIPVSEDGSTSFKPTVSRPKDWVKMVALSDLVAVMSSCPQDMTPINGLNKKPVELNFFVTGR